MKKLSVRGLGLSLGITWGAGVLILGIVAGVNGWGSEWVDLLSKVYRGYDSTFAGSIMGGVWGFVDAGIGGAVIAWLYNRFA